MKKAAASFYAKMRQVDAECKQQKGRKTTRDKKSWNKLGNKGNNGWLEKEARFQNWKLVWAPFCCRN